MFIRNKKVRTVLILYAILYWGSFALSRLGVHKLSALILIGTAIFLYFNEYKKRKHIFDMLAVFSCAWIGGQGLACLQLSRLQTDWSAWTWVCFFSAYVGVYCGYYIMEKEEKKEKKISQISVTARGKSKKLFFCIVGISLVSLVSFIIEVTIVGYVPFFEKFAHAYSYFHVTGVHYFTVSCALIPALSVIFFSMNSLSKKKAGIILVCNGIALLICIFSVSRFQLIFGVGLAITEYFLCFQKINWKLIIAVTFLLAIGYGMLSIFRNHDAGYLNSIFEMKSNNIPIVFTQPYMYIVNNYENFNCLVKELPHHTYGLQMLFPVFALTGLKFIFPSLVEFPDYITRPELNTYTMFYDSYYDFGVIGVFLLAFLLGRVACRLVRAVNSSQGSDERPITYFLYAQMTMYMGLSFFTTWFSLSTTWFWFVLTGGMYLFIEREKSS